MARTRGVPSDWTAVGGLKWLRCSRSSPQTSQAGAYRTATTGWLKSGRTKPQMRFCIFSGRVLLIRTRKFRSATLYFRAVPVNRRYRSHPWALTSFGCISGQCAFACLTIFSTSSGCAILPGARCKERVVRPPATKFKRKTPPFRRGFFV